MSTTDGGGNPMISVHPDELKFIFEVDKQSFCDLKVVNNTERHVAFKVKTTSPKKYFVRPNTGVIQPWDSCVIRVTLQAQREAPPDMICKDKFLLLSTTVPQQTDVVDELPPDTFTKDSNGRVVEECKLRVLYIPPSTQGNGEDELKSPCQSFEGEGNFNMQRLKDDRDVAVRQTQQLQQELDLMKRRSYRKNSPGFSVKFALIVALIGIVLGFVMKWSMSSSSSPSPSPAADLTEVLTPPEV
ncbi:Vesicle-associated protein 2-1 [Linum perenne]